MGSRRENYLPVYDPSKERQPVAPAVTRNRIRRYRTIDEIGGIDASADEIGERINATADALDARIAAMIAERDALIAPMLTEREALRAEQALKRRKLDTLESEAARLGRNRVRVPFRARISALERVRDAIAGVQALDPRWSAVRMESIATLGLRMAARHLERHFNAGKRFPPRGDDLRPGRLKQSPRKRRTGSAP